MLEDLSLFLNRYWHFYCHFFSEQWEDMTPAKYGVLLISIGLLGWLLMRKGPKGI